MLSVEKLRKIDPELAHLSDDEIIRARDAFYELGQIIYEDWAVQEGGSKNPVGLLPRPEDSGTLKP